MKKVTTKSKPPKDHQKTHAILGLALLFGIGRERLTRALSDAGMPTNQKMTVAKAFSALSARFQKQETLTRRQEADAETAEITLAEKKGLLVPKNAARLFVADVTIEMRKLIASKKKWTAKELLLALAKIKLGDAK